MAPGVDRIAGQIGPNPFLQTQLQNSQGSRQQQPLASAVAPSQPQAYQFDSVVFGGGKPKTATDWLQNSLSGSSKGRLIDQTA